MDPMKKRVWSLLCVLFAMTPLSAGDAPQAVVNYRQATMRALAAHMTAMSMVVKKQVTMRGGMAGQAEALHATALGMVDFFPAGTGPDRVDTDARADVWKRANEFKAAAAAFERESARLFEVAKAGNAAAFDAQFAVVGASCASCHKAFRAQDSH